MPQIAAVYSRSLHGLTDLEIGDDRFINFRTVETHRAHGIDKLGIRKRSKLVQEALR